MYITKTPPKGVCSPRPVEPLLNTCPGPANPDALALVPQMRQCPANRSRLQRSGVKAWRTAVRPRSESGGRRGTGTWDVAVGDERGDGDGEGDVDVG